MQQTVIDPVGVTPPVDVPPCAGHPGLLSVVDTSKPAVPPCGGAVHMPLSEIVPLLVMHLLSLKNVVVAVHDAFARGPQEQSLQPRESSHCVMYWCMFG